MTRDESRYVRVVLTEYQVSLLVSLVEEEYQFIDEGVEDADRSEAILDRLKLDLKGALGGEAGSL